MSTVLTGILVEIHEEPPNRIGVVEFHGKRRSVYLNLVPGAAIGAHVSFHAGFATDLVTDAETAYSNPGVSSRYALQLGGPYRLLSELETGQLRKLLPLVEERAYGAGEVIFHSGENSRYLHLIVSGSVQLEEDRMHPSIPVAVLQAGDAMGWSALTQGAKTHFQARALSPVATLALQGKALLELCGREPAIGYALMRRLLELVTVRLDALRGKLGAPTV